MKNSLGLSLYSSGGLISDVKNVEDNEIPFSELECLSKENVRSVIEGIRSCVLTNHISIKNDLSKRFQKSIEDFYGDEYDNFYHTPLNDGDYGLDDTSVFLTKTLNFGYSIGYMISKYGHGNFNFSKIFGYTGEFFDGTFKKVSNKELSYNGPDVDHLKSSYPISGSLTEESLDYKRERNYTDFCIILTQVFVYGLDCGYKMVDLEKELSYNKLGTTKDRYYELIFNKNRSSEEELEYQEIRYQEDVLNHGVEVADRMKKAKQEFDALPKEEQERRKRKNLAKMKADKGLMKSLDKLLKD